MRSFDQDSEIAYEQRAPLSIFLSGSSLQKLGLGAILVSYIVLATALSLTKMPICDEGWYADPAQKLVKNGSMGSPVIESAGGFLKGTDQFTYWEMPLHIFAQAGWYELFGASLFSMRALHCCRTTRTDLLVRNCR